MDAVSAVMSHREITTAASHFYLTNDSRLTMITVHLLLSAFFFFAHNRKCMYIDFLRTVICPSVGQNLTCRRRRNHHQLLPQVFVFSFDCSVSSIGMPLYVHCTFSSDSLMSTIPLHEIYGRHGMVRETVSAYKRLGNSRQ